MKRALNFNAGPAAMPAEVLKKAEKHWLNIADTGMAVMELSHRSKEYEQIHENAIQGLRKLLSIPSDYEVLFIQGGASLQFSMIPMNFLHENTLGNYVLTGSWSEKALKEAQKIGSTAPIASTKENSYRSIPQLSDINTTENAAYLHITSNNTIYGTQWHTYPTQLHMPLIADMSSDILSKQIDINQFGMIYAGAQKNLGPSGVTVVIIHKDLISQDNNHLPTMLQYKTYANNSSLYNTPPTLAIYLLSLVLEWAEEKGGLQAIEKMNENKAKYLYDAIDESDGFYLGHAEKSSRSLMNVTFNLADKEKEALFLQSASDAGFIGLNGHRSIGGCRASIYNAVPEDHVYKLAQFMKSFKRNS
ncbi:3-phosphoserine/phosphohydroxythreonine transaminase [Cytobacillus gottheilii]|uniref:3-phosphoserine/phosphohydroxythreonine transaminase n=1 Tax=Cytobacillus gottheilii TaxID=859144 RepID=UPI000835CF75|nr:3-phosphoserine/phosphohydroxythreonine transaminase [Cytobacillus gottheilii]